MALSPKAILVQEWEQWWTTMAETCARMGRRGEELIGLAAMTQQEAGVGQKSGSRASTVARPTELAAIAHLLARCRGCSEPGHEQLVDRSEGVCPNCGLALPVEDRVALWLADLFPAVQTMRAAASQVDRLDTLIARRGDARVGRQSATQGPCLSCHREVPGLPDDRLRSGLCDMCRKRYERWRDGREDPTVTKFVASVEKEEEAVCPRPSCRQPLLGDTCPRCGFKDEELHA